VRTQAFIDELDTRAEPLEGAEPIPDRIDRIAFKEVRFSYDDGEPTVEDLSFSVERDEFVAFVGPSGAGKSTIVSLLARLYEPDAGRITANWTPIDTFNLREWRESVAVVRQHPFVLNDTLRYNVTVGDRDASQAEVERACEIAQVTEFLNELPEGYDTVLGDDGVRLSGGQRQRIAIARALLKDADVLLLDEATSDLDTTLETAIHKGIESLESDCLTITIAHRFSTVRGTDRIYAIEDGTIRERGDHNTLIESDGVYAGLYDEIS